MTILTDDELTRALGKRPYPHAPKLSVHPRNCTGPGHDIVERWAETVGRPLDQSHVPAIGMAATKRLPPLWDEKKFGMR